MPRCDSSETYMRAVRPSPSPTVLRSGWTAGVSEVSRFSCMKFLGVPGVFDYAGLYRNSRWRSCSCCLPRISRTSASGLHLFGAPYPPRLYLCLRFAAYLTIGLAQDSRPSRSLLLSRGTLSFSTSYRFIPAHCNGDFSITTRASCVRPGLLPSDLSYLPKSPQFRSMPDGTATRETE